MIINHNNNNNDNNNKDNNNDNNNNNNNNNNDNENENENDNDNDNDDNNDKNNTDAGMDNDKEFQAAFTRGTLSQAPRPLSVSIPHPRGTSLPQRPWRSSLRLLGLQMTPHRARRRAAAEIMAGQGLVRTDRRCAVEASPENTRGRQPSFLRDFRLAAPTRNV